MVSVLSLVLFKSSFKFLVKSLSSSPSILIFVDHAASELRWSSGVARRLMDEGNFNEVPDSRSMTHVRFILSLISCKRKLLRGVSLDYFEHPSDRRSCNDWTQVRCRRLLDEIRFDGVSDSYSVYLVHQGQLDRSQ